MVGKKISLRKLLDQVYMFNLEISNPFSKIVLFTLRFRCGNFPKDSNAHAQLITFN